MRLGRGRVDREEEVAVVPLARRIGALVVVATVALAAAAQPAVAGKKARPDLVIVDGGLAGDDHAIPGEKNVLRLADETENRGYRAAGPSRTGVSFSAPRPFDDEFSHDGFTRRVRKLKGFVGDASAKISRSPKLEFRGLPPGAYRMTICADVRDQVKERNEKNNCLTVRDSHLFITKRTWAGTLGGTYSHGTGDLRDSWASSEASLHLADYLGDGRFFYHFGGTVTWTTSGTDAAGCNWSGTGTEVFTPSEEPGDVLLDLDAGEYQGSLTAGIEYPTSAQCPGGSRSSIGPDSTVFLSTTADGARGPHPFPFGTEALAGTSSLGSTAAWSWDFR
jgi:hypothetical protein